MILSWLACGPGLADLAFEHGPVVTPNPSGAGGVVWIDVTTSEATTLSVAVEDRVGPVRHVRGEGSDTRHHVLVGGLRPDHAHTLRVIARSAGGDVVVHALDYVSPPLPEDLPPFEVRHSAPDRMEPGWTLVHLGTYLTMLDPEGTVRWVLPVGTDPVYTFGRAPAGTLFYQSTRQLLTEIDYSGAVLGQWCAAEAPTPLPGCPVPESRATPSRYNSLGPSPSAA
ncbi:MAG: aryl-sulfate sulfotransferase N-terminal domain-containing protein, partial [Myxococcales bacterium]|nr:aryl-sulfate sulfotransferase N-terminal domain-containing protein [Myxococcales bacterium]